MVDAKVWGRYQGKEVWLYTITNKNGTSVSVCEFGGIVVSLLTKDRNGKLDDVVFGYDTLDEYIADRYYMGAILGRCANRIKNPVFNIGSNEVHLSQNQGAFPLHGGAKGFHKCCWSGQIVNDQAVAMQRVSPDGEEGYPGNLCVTVVYSLDDFDELTIRYTAATDQDTLVSLSNHSYFHLAGSLDGETIENDSAMINSDYFVQIDSDCCSAGAVLPVDGTPHDLRTAAKLGEGITSGSEQIALGSGYNHTFVLNPSGGHAATVWNEKSGRRMDVFTNQPGIHLYTGNYLSDAKGKNGKKFRRYGALCFETQHYPDAINIPHFPSPVLRKCEVYHTVTSFKFSSFESLCE